MGYDMYWEKPDLAEKVTVDAIHEKLKGVGWGSDEAGELYRELDKAQKSYFQLNIWGMGGARRALLSLGMLGVVCR